MLIWTVSSQHSTAHSWDDSSQVEKKGGEGETEGISNLEMLIYLARLISTPSPFPINRRAGERAFSGDLDEGSGETALSPMPC